MLNKGDFNVDTTQNIISFCTGYGGIELGLELAGVDVRTVAACEIETYAIANLVEKMETGSLEPFPIWTDLKTFDSRPFRGKIHGITGGYPCQPFSHAGQRKGTEDPRHLWPYICKHIDTIRPLWVFLENVAGHLTLGFDEVYKSLRGLGYSVEAGLFTASEVGATHKRQRLFILAYTGSIYPERANQDRTDRKGICELPRGNEVWSEDSGCGEGYGWPARPGQPQYEWEGPRTIESSLGRTANGTATRVDRLRLLGNGVVRQCAAKAWIELWKRSVS